MRRLIYSQLPLPLGTLPLIQVYCALFPPFAGGHQPVDDAEGRNTVKKGLRPGAFMGDAACQSQPKPTLETPTFSAWIGLLCKIALGRNP